MSSKRHKTDAGTYCLLMLDMECATLQPHRDGRQHMKHLCLHLGRGGSDSVDSWLLAGDWQRHSLLQLVIQDFPRQGFQA